MAPRALITSIRLENFKAFIDTGRIPLKPITLLVGKNSAGKSSLIKAILAASQTARQEELDNSYFRLIGDYTNLGTYADTVHGNDTKTNFSIGFGVEDSNDLNYNIRYTFSQNQKNTLGTSLVGIQVHHDHHFVLSARKPLKGNSRERWVGVMAAIGGGAIELSYPKVTDAEIFEREEERELPDFIIRFRDFMREENEISEPEDMEYIHKIAVRDFEIEVAKMPRNERDRGRGQFRFGTGDELQPCIGRTPFVSNNLNRILSKTIYLSGLREEPSRIARLAQSSGNRIGIKGEDLATMLHQRRDNKKFMDKFNSHLQVLGIADSATTAPSYMMSEGKEVETGFIKILLEHQGATRSLMDLGFGTSQVLPVVFELGLRKERLILIEQPELHLHPAAQSEIGSILAHSIEQGNQLIVETHSANMIERLRRLIREGELDKDDVNIIYIGKDEESGGSRCDVIGFDEKGEFTETWPEESFFGERELEYLDW